MNYKPGTRLKVKPVIFYPKGQKPNKTWATRWEQFHLAAGRKYFQMLKNRDTFELAKPTSYQGAQTAGEYFNLCFSDKGLQFRSQLRKKGGCSCGVETIVSELLLYHPQIKPYTRYTLPWCLSILIMDPGKAWNSGGGRTLNGDLNLGAGILVIGSWLFAEGKLMSTLLHELGHAFGLVHSWGRPVKDRVQKSCYYDQNTSNAIMSYNPANWTNSTQPANIPGWLLGDDIEALSQNKYLFPKLHFDPQSDFDCPPSSPGCPPHDQTTHPLHLGPMHLVFCTTDFPSDKGSITVLNDHSGRWILPSDPENGFNAKRMWRSGAANAEGWVSMEVTFPVSLALNRILFYTECGGDTDKAEMIQVEREIGNGQFEFVRRVVSPDPATEVKFFGKKARTWRFAFQAGSSGKVVVRGMRWFYNDREYFPPLGPQASTVFGETWKSKVANLVEVQRVIRGNNPSTGFDPRSMWHSGTVNEKGWASLEVIFPVEVELDKVTVFSQHSGKYHAAKKIQIEVFEDQKYRLVIQTPKAGPIKAVTFPATRGKAWKLAFLGESGGYIVIRGLRFFIGEEEYYPPAKVSYASV